MKTSTISSSSKTKIGFPVVPIQRLRPDYRLKLSQEDCRLRRRRMMSKVPKASVVVTNPTQYAAALEYHLETVRAPVVTAKGLNYLAQALYKSCQIGSEIPGSVVPGGG